MADAHSASSKKSPVHGATGWIVASIPALIAAYFLWLLSSVAGGETLRIVYPWIPSLDINLSFHIDGLGIIFALLVSCIGTLIVIYAGGYLADDPQLPRFYVYILSFMLAMLGAVLSDNILTLFVFWELTSITSYMLIGYKHTYADSRESAKQALIITGSGGLSLLAGLILLAIAAGSWEISEMLAQGTNIGDHPLYLPALILILGGAFTKSAQFPFHFWLPGAMAAPTPVSAYLHSATMVKLGVYLVARFNPVLGDTDAWFYLLGGFGALTMFVGAYLGWQHTDLKRILAYSTVSALGTLVMLIGIGSELAIEGAMVFLVVHSLYKGTLFMVAGAVDHETGTRDIRNLGGLRHAMPITAGAACLAALSMAGIPPFYGFLGKEIIYEATLNAPLMAVFIAVVGNALTIIAAGLVTLRVFFGKEGDPPKHPHEAPASMWLGPVILSGLGFLLGLFIPIFKGSTATFVTDTVVQPGVHSILNSEYEVYLYLWHGLSTPLMLSILTVALGVCGYLLRDQMLRLATPIMRLTDWVSPKRGYELSLEAVLDFAAWQTVVLQNGKLRYYIIVTLVTMISLVLYAFSRWLTLDQLALNASDVQFYEIILFLLIVISAIYAAVTQSRLTAVTLLGVVGYGVGLIFILYGAPDLAMTQFSIETLMVILLVLVIYRLPRYETITRLHSRIRDVVVAGTSGLVVTLLVLATLATTSPSRLSPYFSEVSYELAKGKNVVNVILVDFRGIDTMGEIVVLAIAAIGVFALMRLRLGKEHSSHK